VRHGSRIVNLSAQKKAISIAKDVMTKDS